jgi:hypothetical protein
MPSGLRVSFAPLYEYARISAKLCGADYSNWTHLLANPRMPQWNAALHNDAI